MRRPIFSPQERDEGPPASLRRRSEAQSCASRGRRPIKNTYFFYSLLLLLLLLLAKRRQAGSPALREEEGPLPRVINTRRQSRSERKIKNQILIYPKLIIF